MRRMPPPPRKISPKPYPSSPSSGVPHPPIKPPHARHMREWTEQKSSPPLSSFPRRIERRNVSIHQGSALSLAAALPPALSEPLVNTLPPFSPLKQLMIFYWFVGDGRFLKGKSRGKGKAALPSPRTFELFAEGRKGGSAVH